MIHKKEFYYVRHGQTDHNAAKLTTDHLDIPLNSVGREQAHGIAELIASLPIKTVCFSPLKRAKETKNIVTTGLIAPEYEILDLSECSGQVWIEMTSLGKSAFTHASEPVKTFMRQVQNGINHALSQTGPVLIVAHGGVHWAMCCLMEVDHEWAIDNCVPIHFAHDEVGTWKAKRLLS